MQNCYYDANEYRHKKNCFTSRAKPNDDKRTECDFWQCIQNDDIRLQDLSERITPPEQKCNGKAERNRDCKARKRFPQCHADMIKQRSVVVEPDDRIDDPNGGTYDERICPADHGHKFPNC